MNRYLLACLIAIFFTSVVFGQNVVEKDSLSQKENIDTAQLTERLQMIRQMLDRNEKNAGIWWYGWIGVYGAATVGQAAVACLDKNKSTREDMILGAGTTLFGVAGQLIAPVKSGYNSKKEELTGRLSRESEIEALRQAEAMLKFQADRAKSGKNWQTHALSGAVNLTSGLITWIGFKRSVWEGIGNFALNTAVTEFQIWSQPTKAIKDYEQYCSKYGLADYKPSKRPEFEWYAHIQPGMAGFGVSF
jgi:hypothetical protein